MWTTLDIVPSLEGSSELLPFNISLLNVTDQYVSAMRPVTAVDIFEGATSNLHPDGLFSQLIFGRPGEERRDRQFSFIDLKVTVFHPLIYKALITVKALYDGIILGTNYARWDDQLKDFVPSDALHGQTGFSFFLQHWRDIVHRQTNSPARTTRIALIEKYKDVALTNKILVMPAGLRDIEMKEDGRMEQGEVNEFYRKILRANIAVSSTMFNGSDSTLDATRKSIQRNFLALYEFIEKTLSGKRGFIQNKWASRSTYDGTRNVITALDSSSSDMKGPRALQLTDCTVGLFQHIKAIEPVTKHFLATGWVSRVFGAVSGKALLTNPKTLKAEYVEISTDEWDQWNSEEGLTKVINSFADPIFRHRPVRIAKHYIGLIYLGPDMTFRMFSSIDELPKHLDRAHVHPITLCQLIYLSGYREWNRYPALITRYPITGIGSIFPATSYVKTTIESEVRFELDEQWQRLGPEYQAPEFPITSVPAFIDSLAIPTSRVEGAGADFDGDMCSYVALYTEESINEIHETLSKASAFLSPGGGFKTEVSNFTIDLVLHNMTHR